MSETQLNIVILGLTITSSWGNGHATTYRGLVRALERRGHRVLFLERDVPWYANNRDLPSPPYGRTELYNSLDDLRHRFASQIADADMTIVGSYVPEGVSVGRWATQVARGPVAFYDIDTPVTFAKLSRGDEEYLTADLIPGYDLYLSFTGGPVLRALERDYGSPMARPLYCSVDPELYRPMDGVETRWDLAYLGTYSPDRQSTVDRLLVQTARRWHKGRFAVAGPQYPEEIDWPNNVWRTDHLPPAAHADFYNSQRFTLNVTRASMRQWGHCPSVRLFEAAACGTPIISDGWDGMDEILTPGEEILVLDSTEEVLEVLQAMPEQRRQQIAGAARQRILSAHTAAHRAQELESYALQLLGSRTRAGW